MKYSLSLLLLLIWSVSLNAQTTVVGSTEGVFNVSDLGAANYSIPIKIPDCIGGLQPSLSLSYSSQGGNGIVGIGWNLGGSISAIGRIPNTIYNDKKVTGASLTPEDRFALDGSRLILTGGTYGLASSSYHTEVESFRDIKALGTLGSGPMSFIVTDQNGTKFEYGIKALSRPTVQGKVEPYIWLLDKVTDLNGNFMEYFYEYNQEEEPRVTYISYTGNVNTGAPAKSGISFYYENKPDLNFTYIAGGKIRQGYRLKYVYIRQQDEANAFKTLHSYELQYAMGQYSHLVKVIEKGNELNGAPEQLPATVFSYGSTAAVVGMAQDNNAAGGGLFDESVTGDFNADGKTDILKYIKENSNATAINNNAFQLYLNNGFGFSLAQTGTLFRDNTLSPASNQAPIPLNNKSNDGIPFDYNADGYEDFLYTQEFQQPIFLGQGKGQLYTVYLSNGSLINSQRRIMAPGGGSFYNTKPFIGDFDGDGRVEALVLNTKVSNSPNNYMIGSAYTTPNGSNTSQGLPIDIATPLSGVPFDASYLESKESKIYVIDYNGDGKSDILSIWRDNAAGVDHAQVLEMNVTFDANNKPVVGNPAFKLISDNGYPTLYHEILPGDFNGDRITDVLTWNEHVNGGWEIGYGKGNGSMTDIRSNTIYMANNTPNSPYSDNVHRPVLVGDYDGDGKTDIFEFTATDNQYGWSHEGAKIFYSKGNHQFVTETLNLSNEGVLGKFLQDYRAGDFNGDGAMDLYVVNPIEHNVIIPGPSDPYGPSDRWSANIFNFHAFESRHSISKITNGLGGTIQIGYSPLTDPDIYTQGNNYYTYPYIKKTVALKVVTSATHDNGTSFGNTTSYRYKGFKYNVHGKGLMGFDKVIAIDQMKNIIREQTFALSTTYAIPCLESTLVTTGQGQILNTSSNLQQIYHYGMNRILPYTELTTSTDYIKNNTVTQSYIYSLPSSNILGATSSMHTGKPQSITTNKGNGLETTTQTFTYPAMVSFTGSGLSYIPVWVYSKPKSIITANTRQGQPAYTRRQDFAYSAANGLLLNSVSDPGTSHAITTTNTYNAYGNPIQKTVSAGGMAPRTEIFRYDPTNRFLTKSYNADYPALQTNTVYNIVTGAVSQIKQADGFVKSFTYDGFNRVKTTADNNGASATISNIWAAGNPYAPANAKYGVQTSTNTSGTSFTFYDRLGRVLRTASPGLNGQMVFADQQYDNKGQLISKTDPYFQGGAIQNNTFSYDALGRVTYQSSPSGNNSSFSYTNTTDGAVSTTTNAAGQSKKSFTDKSGTVIKTQDEGGILEYTYLSNGKIKSTTMNGTTVQQYEYDQYGRNTKRTDPNYGSYEYSYDNFDQLLYEKDPKGQVSNYAYNNLGKMITKSCPEGVYAYTYNTTGGTDCGKLIQMSGPGGVLHKYSYGMGDKVNAEESTIGNEVFKTELTYDAYGRTKTKKYPNNTIVEYTYNTNDGSLQSIGRPGAVYYTPMGQQPAYLYSVVDKNAFGQITESGQQSQFSGGTTLSAFKFSTVQSYNVYGLLTQQHTFTQATSVSPTITLRNYQYSFQNTTGNLLQRKDLKYNLREDFTYDNVNRLINIQGQNYGSGSSMFAPQTMDYAANGNVTQKSDAGTFSYDQANRVSEINPYINIPEVPQDITYTPFDKVATVEEGINKAQFSYWADEDRAKMELLENGVLKKTKYYAGGFEKEIDATTGVVRELCYIYGPDDNLVSIIEKKNGVENTYFVQTDHLGSITQIFDGNGTIVEEKSFDAWGRGRNPQSWAVLPPTGISNGWDRGYTGHEQLSQFGIVNMNGRLYDPLMGRMMEPDPLIIGTNNSQGYNRYSYALNNPLSYTDPDGHHPILIAAAIGAAVSAAMYTGSVAFSNAGFANWNWGKFASSTIIGGVAGAATSGIGSIFGAVWSNGVMGEVARAAMHGASNTIFSAIGGGDPGWSTFAAGAAGSLVGMIPLEKVPVLNTHVGGLGLSMTMGGVSSSVLGGSFIEGAISAGLVHELNFQAHKANTEATVYIESDGIGHVYMEVNGTVFSYGRYNGSYSPSSGAFGPYGDGVLMKKSGTEANNFIKERSAKFPTNSYKVKLNSSKAYSYFNNLYNNGKPIVDNNGNLKPGRVIDTYSLVGPGGNNCTTIVSRALQAGGNNIGIFQTPASMNLFFTNSNAMRNGYNPGLWGPKQ